MVGHIPKIASIAGIRVGLDTLETLEKRFGPALRVMGGHPRGARVWRSRQTKWFIYADGFGYNDQGERVIDQFTVYTDDSTAKIPRASVPRQQLMFMNAVALGMTRHQVRYALRHKLPAPTVQGNHLIWKMKGLVRINEARSNDEGAWQADLRFPHEKLDAITVSIVYAGD